MTATNFAHAPAAATPRLDIDGLSDVGRVRSLNEDHFVVLELTKSVELRRTNLEDVSFTKRLKRPVASLLAVADGVGGLAGGELASRMTVQVISEYLGELAGCYQGLDVEREHRFLDQLTEAVERAHARLTETFEGHSKPATTLTMAVLLWPRAYIVHVGDSRVYLLRRGRLRQVTRDQTMGEIAVDLGLLTEERAKERGMYNVLASAVGGDLVPTVGLVDLEHGDSLVLCTDGLTKHVTDERIAQIVGASPSAERACHTLIDEALAGGGSDNVTVIVARQAD